ATPAAPRLSFSSIGALLEDFLRHRQRREHARPPDVDPPSSGRFSQKPNNFLHTPSSSFSGVIGSSRTRLPVAWKTADRRRLPRTPPQRHASRSAAPHRPASRPPSPRSAARRGASHP